ncbi:MAG: helix-turn-helix transcriptional regulator [Oceanicoccus sp.]|uniref:helix-turn-helix transcriptional regulator n=2 Tax=Oceanicoccus sp. TaxID=2691044 RepID=UPI0026133CAA|nr:helix-turn-helix transcriptional regulator [Oceanicoccus sp.]MDG1771802.1 helix-turn-helix transcriptional regulator [Oceanicoccus sp.]
MIDNSIKQLGQKIAALRIAKKLKQSELAYEAGVSERTLQRLEAGDIIKSDGLLKVVMQLGRLEELLATLDTPEFSPYDMVASTRAKYSAGTQSHKTRVRHSKQDKLSKTRSKNATIVWPEDQS